MNYVQLEPVRTRIPNRLDKAFFYFGMTRFEIVYAFHQA